MKRIETYIMLFLCFLLLAGSTRFTLHHHYCGQILVSSSLSILPDGGPCCGMKSMDCCSDDYVHFEGTDEYQQKLNAQLQLPSQLIAAMLPADAAELPAVQPEMIQPPLRPPPELPPSIPAFIRFAAFLC